MLIQLRRSSINHTLNATSDTCDHPFSNLNLFTQHLLPILKSPRNTARGIPNNFCDSNLWLESCCVRSSIDLINVQVFTQYPVFSWQHTETPFRDSVLSLMHCIQKKRLCFEISRMSQKERWKFGMITGKRQPAEVTISWRHCLWYHTGMVVWPHLDLCTPWTSSKSYKFHFFWKPEGAHAAPRCTPKETLENTCPFVRGRKEPATWI